MFTSKLTVTCMYALQSIHTQKIVKHNCQELIETVPFFENAPEIFITAVLTHLKFELFLPGEYIVRQGCKGDKMYFIQRGVVEVITDDGTVVAHLSEGAHFGEICLLREDRRVASIKANTMCDLFSLSKTHFQEMLEEFPEMRPFFEMTALQRLSTIGTQDTDKCKDHSTCIIHNRYSHTDECSGLAAPLPTPLKQEPKTPNRPQQDIEQIGERESTVYKRLSSGRLPSDRTEHLRDEEYAKINPHFVPLGENS